jgi:hypothetical protein
VLSRPPEDVRRRAWLMKAQRPRTEARQAASFSGRALTGEACASATRHVKPLVRCANGFAATAEAQRIAANIAKLAELLRT